jgi:hypothetical protein
MDELPQLGKATVAVKVAAVDGAHPTQLELSVKSAGNGLKGRVFTAEVMSGELVLRDTKSVARERPQQEAARLFRPFVAGLLRDDPIVTAMRAGGDPCSADVRARVLEASAREVHRLVGSELPFELGPGGEASCGKKKGSGYGLKFNLTLRAGEYTVVFPFKGTVEVPPKGWHADLDVSATTKFDMPGYGVKGKMTASCALKTALR